LTWGVKSAPIKGETHPEKALLMFKKVFRRSLFWSLVLLLLVFAIKQFPDRSLEAASAFRAGDIELAAKFWTKMSKLGDPEAQYNLGALYSIGEGVVASAEKAHTWFLAAAEAGNPAAQFEVGKTYAAGAGVARNVPVALLWFEESATQGYTAAQVELGLRYMNGDGVSRDPDRAAFWFNRAAGNDRAPPVLIGGLPGAAGAIPCFNAS
jgi:TPR repeat protein